MIQRKRVVANYGAGHDLLTIGRETPCLEQAKYAQQHEDPAGNAALVQVGLDEASTPACVQWPDRTGS